MSAGHGRKHIYTHKETACSQCEPYYIKMLYHVVSCCIMLYQVPHAGLKPPPQEWTQCICFVSLQLQRLRRNVPCRGVPSHGVE